MKWLEILGAVFQLIFLLLKKWLEKDAAIKAKQEVAVTMVKEGIATGNVSLITAGFDSINSK